MKHTSLYTILRYAHAKQALVSSTGGEIVRWTTPLVSDRIFSEVLNTILAEQMVYIFTGHR
ncbi:hypothetical protein [Nostoc sp. FACHB-888]|uniref:hypothetical protein n=1 Tax=Nostoc sp. FACHB-888 TaxID=2692842 RepID=UPI001682AE84|nr:hypothetical protein [Nostoc sp. FACHB-888]MBD2246747.1 hypothetical protein [Nostoc sp. FACHB-888]